MLDPCTTFDEYVLGQIFTRLPLDTLRLSAYNVSRGWRAALDASKAVRAALLAEPNLNRHVQDHLRALDRDSGATVDWNERALSFLAQESAWRGGRGKLRYGRSVLSCRDPSLSSYDCIGRRLLVLETPWPEESGDPSPDWALQIVDLDTLDITARVVLPPANDYMLFCEDHLGHILGQTLTSPGEPGKPDLVTVNVWVQDRDEGGYEWITRTGCEADCDDTLEGFKLLAAFPVGNISSFPGVDYHVDEKAGGMTLTAVTETQMGRVRIHHLADRLPIGSAGLPGHIDRVRLPGPDRMTGYQEPPATTVDDNWIFHMDQRLRIYSRSGNHLLTIQATKAPVAAAGADFVPAVGYQFVDKALILTYVSGGIVVIPHYDDVFKAAASLEATQREPYVASKSFMIDTGFYMSGSTALGWQGHFQYDAYGTRMMVAVDDVILIIDTAGLSHDTLGAPLPVLALTGQTSTYEGGIQEERLYLTSWGLYHCLNLQSVGDDEMEAVREAQGLGEGEHPFDKELEDWQDGEKFVFKVFDFTPPPLVP
ncbi:hypothetical protein Q8F55_008511 [Vanrija albida]|uniref:F-box domain-containing protein n=1 Tax=Vanrija albida TaxID=181172 RepID=A0ABR3PR83_9TREE